MVNKKLLPPINIKKNKMLKKLLLTTITLLTLLSLNTSEKIYTGTASYYGQHWTGRLTSSGEKFYSDSLTAAHKYFKFGTIVKVTNTSNDSVRYVKINDRLPKHLNQWILFRLRNNIFKTHTLTGCGFFV